MTCPECEEEIDYLKTISSVSEYGSSNVYGEDIDVDDSDYNDTEYRCPECNEEINPMHRRERPQSSQPAVVGGSNGPVERPSMLQNRISSIPDSATCKTCDKTYLQNPQEIIECCGNVISNT